MSIAVGVYQGSSRVAQGAYLEVEYIRNVLNILVSNIMHHLDSKKNFYALQKILM